MPGASMRDIALQKLAYGEITEHQYRVLEARYFPPAAPPPPPPPVQIPAWELPLINPVARPGDAPIREASPFDVDPSKATSADLDAMFSKLLKK